MRNTNLNSWTLKKYQIEQAKEEKKNTKFSGTIASLFRCGGHRRCSILHFSFVAFVEKMEKRFSMVMVFQKVVYVDLDLTLKVVICNKEEKW
jgi:hypothetical protein